MNPEIDAIIARYFSGESTDADMAALDEWLAASDENEKLFDQLTALYEKTAPPHAAAHRPDTTEALRKLQKHIDQSGSKVRPLRRKDFYWPAAAIILLLVGLFLIQQQQKGKTTQLAATEQTESYYLPDSTVVTLAPHSQIDYDKNYNATNRIIRLAGKATFDVGKHGCGQLTVVAGDLMIQDIGTVFTVEAYAENSTTKVEVESGKVLLVAVAEQPAEIPAGATGIFDKASKSIEIVQIERQPENEAAPAFTFDATPLREVIQLLTQRYGVDIRLANPALGQRQISVQFYDENIDVILHIIAETLELKLSRANGAYVLSN